MFNIILIIFSIFFILSIGVIIGGAQEYREHIKKLSKKYTLEEIEKKIQKEKDFSEKTNTVGIMLESALEKIEMWEQVKTYKLTGSF